MDADPAAMLAGRQGSIMSTQRATGGTTLGPAWRRLIEALAIREMGQGGGAMVVAWAEAALEAHVDSPSLRVLAGLSVSPNEFEVDRYLSAVAAELGFVLPERGALLSLYALQVAGDIVRRSVTPRVGAKHLYDVSRVGGSVLELSVWSGLDDAVAMAESGTYGTVEEVESEIIKQAQSIVSGSPGLATPKQGPTQE